MQQSKQLSKADSKILAQVFDPESAPTRAEVLVNPDLPADRHISDADQLGQFKAREKEAIALIEQYEESCSSPGGKDISYHAALAILDKLVAECPNYASARNNRAQLRRWKFGDRGTLCQKRDDTDHERRRAVETAVSDLQKCISLASPSRPQDAVSPAQGRLLAQAYTQLAAILYAAFKDLDAIPIAEDVVIGKTSWTKDRLEDEASRLFYLGGLFGNEVAKALAVHTNPHAKLCGNIVKEAMKKELAAAQ